MSGWTRVGTRLRDTRSQDHLTSEWPEGKVNTGTTVRNMNWGLKTRVYTRSFGSWVTSSDLNERWFIRLRGKTLLISSEGTTWGLIDSDCTGHFSLFTVILGLVPNGREKGSRVVVPYEVLLWPDSRTWVVSLHLVSTLTGYDLYPHSLFENNNIYNYKPSE